MTELHLKIRVFFTQMLKALDSGHMDFNPQFDSVPLQRSSGEYEALGGTISAWRKTDKKETFLLLL